MQRAVVGVDAVRMDFLLREQIMQVFDDFCFTHLVGGFAVMVLIQPVFAHILLNGFDARPRVSRSKVSFCRTSSWSLYTAPLQTLAFAFVKDGFFSLFIAKKA